MAGPFEINHYLSGVKYPISKDAAVLKARENDAPEDVISSIESLPRNSFDSAFDIMGLSGGRDDNRDETVNNDNM